jgi:signal peptidase complex subunit 3
MHSTIARVQNVFGFFTTVAFVVAALIAATDLIAPRAPRATITVNDVQVSVLSIYQDLFCRQSIS